MSLQNYDCAAAVRVCRSTTALPQYEFAELRLYCSSMSLQRSTIMLQQYEFAEVRLLQQYEFAESTTVLQQNKFAEL